MFGKKNKVFVMSWGDGLYNDWKDALTTLQTRAKQAYIKAETLKVYDLEAPDGEAAKKDFNRAKDGLLCAIGHYESTLIELKDYCKYHEEETQNWNVDFYTTSHEQVEKAISELFKR